MKKTILMSLAFWQFGTAALAITPSQKKDLVVSRAIRLNDALGVETFYAIHPEKNPNTPLFVSQELELRPFSMALIRGHEQPAFDVLMLLKRMHVVTQYHEPLLENSSPLHMVLRYLPSEEATAATYFLLKNGVHGNLVLRNDAEQTPQELAEKLNHPTLEMFKKFEPPELRDMSSAYIPQAYFQGQKKLAHYGTVVDMIQQLQNALPLEMDLNEKQANALVLDAPWRPVLHEALRLGQVRNANTLLKAGADLSAKDALGNRALHYAAQQKNTQVLQWFLTEGPYLNPLNTQKETPLHLALKNRLWDNAILLLEKGANTSLKDKNGKSPKALFLEAKTAQHIKDSQKIQILHQRLGAN